MFDLVFSAVSSVNQIVTLLAGLACLGVGGLLVGNALYWALHAVRVQGQVIGVRQRGSCFNAVYRYVSPSGQTCEATSLEGSDSLPGKETGALVALLVIPHKPDEAQEASSHLFTLLGVVLLGIGAVILWIGATRWRTGPMTWFVAALFVAHFAQRLWSVVFPKDKSLSISGWRAQWARQKAAAIQAAPVQRLEDLTSLPDYRAKQAAQRANARRYAPLLMLAGLGLFGLGVHQNRTLLRLESSGTRAPGTVTSLSSSSSSNGNVTYYPVVTYTNNAGKAVVFKDSTGSSPPLYRSGDPVTVLYSPGMTGSAIIDRGVWNWLPSLLLYLFGTVLTLVSIGLFRQRSVQGVSPAQLTGGADGSGLGEGSGGAGEH